MVTPRVELGPSPLQGDAKSPSAKPPFKPQLSTPIHCRRGNQHHVASYSKASGGNRTQPQSSLQEKYSPLSVASKKCYRALKI